MISGTLWTTRLVAAGALLMAVAVVSAPPTQADNPNPLFDLIDAAAQRLQTAEPVAAIKWKTNGQIEDPPRVQQVLAAVTADAKANRIAPDYVSRIFTDQINATDAIEYTRFAQWKLDAASAPATPPELAASRSLIDTLNGVMVTQIALHRDVLESPDCTPLLNDAKAAVTQIRQLDSLYQQALSSASQAYCQG